MATVTPWPVLTPITTSTGAGPTAVDPRWGLWFSGIRSEVNRVGAAILQGKGSPQTVVTAPIGTLYLRSDGGASTTLYVKESGTGNTGWVAK